MCSSYRLTCLFVPTGPALSGSLVQKFGFKWMLYGIAIINFLYAPFMYCLKSPPAKDHGERQVSGGGNRLEKGVWRGTVGD